MSSCDKLLNHGSPVNSVAEDTGSKIPPLLPHLPCVEQTDGKIEELNKDIKNKNNLIEWQEGIINSQREKIEIMRGAIYNLKNQDRAGAIIYLFIYPIDSSTTSIHEWHNYAKRFQLLIINLIILTGLCNCLWQFLDWFLLPYLSP
jgi:hypothetical protein